MNVDDDANAFDAFAAKLSANAPLIDALRASGRFRATLTRDGTVIWEEEFENVVTTVGKNLAFNTTFAGAAYSVTGPYMGLISSQGFTGTAVGDTMASHAGWEEAGNANPPTYSGTRPVASFAAASGGAIALSATTAYNFTGTGIVEGAFIVLGTGAVGTIDNTAGVLWSAGTFSGGITRQVYSGDQLNLSYSASM